MFGTKQKNFKLKEFSLKLKFQALDILKSVKTYFDPDYEQIISGGTGSCSLYLYFQLFAHPKDPQKTLYQKVRILHHSCTVTAPG